MIKFDGLISEDNQKVIIKQEKRMLFFAALIPFLIFGTLTVFAAIYMHLIYLLFFIPFAFFLTIPLFPLSKKTLDLMIPLQIKILDDVIISEGKNFKCVRKIADIKKVIDYGTYYQIYFNWPKKSFKFLCQKDLVEDSTLRDFEVLFQNKIIKKI